MTVYVKNGEPVTIQWALDRSEPDEATGCWDWTGTKSRGYGVASLCRVRQGAYRFAWEIAHDQRIPDGMEIDHTCFNRACVNPGHLELVTHTENIARRRPYSTAKPFCKRGHEMVGDNVVPVRNGTSKRKCRECSKIHQRAYYARQKATGNWKPSRRRPA